MRLFSILDLASSLYGAPFQAPNAALAIRLFEQAQLDTAHVFATHPGDFRIYYLGTFDENTAEWDLLPHPEPIVTPLPKAKE